MFAHQNPGWSKTSHSARRETTRNNVTGKHVHVDLELDNTEQLVDVGRCSRKWFLSLWRWAETCRYRSSRSTWIVTVESRAAAPSRYTTRPPHPHKVWVAECCVRVVNFPWPDPSKGKLDPARPVNTNKYFIPTRLTTRHGLLTTTTTFYENIKTVSCSVGVGRAVWNGLN